MQVIATVEEIDMEGDYGDVPSVCVICTRCAHRVEVFGDGVASVRRGLATLREECPRAESNFYVAGGG